MDASTVLFTCNAFGLTMKERHLFFTLCGLAGPDGSVDVPRGRLTAALGCSAGLPDWVTTALLEFAQIGCFDLGATGEIRDRIEGIPKLVQAAP